MEDSVTFVIMGATGDLAALKLIPAIYALVKSEKVRSFAIVGVARSEVNINDILLRGKNNIKNVDENIWKKVVESSYYSQVDFTKEEDFVKLGEILKDVEKKHDLSGKRMFYLATLPEHFEAITKNLSRSKIALSEAKVLYEKPFGKDLKSAQGINKLIREVFNEKQIYRVDHYLGKEIVGNIVLLRFTNRILEPLWNKDNIDSIQIIMDENFGIKNRGKFYDEYGAIKDILQNHVLQIISLLTMESPKMLTGEYIRDKKVEALKKTHVKDIILGQYHGYRNEIGVLKNSKTETFFVAKLEINNDRWKGVPFFVRAGKNLAKKQSLIIIKFKKVDCLLTHSCPTDTNYLTIRIQPDDGFSFEINSKSANNGFRVTPINMDFSNITLRGPNTPESYEIILEEALLGEQSMFVRSDEIEEQWRIVDNISKTSAYSYVIGSSGPIELKDWQKKHNLFWKA